MKKVNTIETRTFFSDWKKTDRNTAKKLVEHMINHSNVPKKELIPLIEKRFLKGITVKDLLKKTKT